MTDIYPTGSVLTDLQTLYSDPRRVYHTWDHITYMLDSYADFARREVIQVDMVQVYAIWFHDVVYLPESTKNELNSAFFADSYLRALSEDAETAHSVSAIILDTVSPHISWHERSQLVIDLDLLVLSESREVYEDYSRKVREEYAHVPDRSWLSERRAFLKRMLVREPFFYSSFFQTRKTNACRNIYTELKIIEKQLGLE
jgi:predicted metal-dependent HD superfamily phosphohydrolase